MNSQIKEFFSLENRTKYFVHFIFSLCFIASAVFAMILLGGKTGDGEVVADQKTEIFKNLKIQAKGAMVYDVVGNEELFSKNPDEPLPLASLTKVMSAIVIEKRLSGSQKVKITGDDLLAQGDSGLLVGDVWKASDLRDFTLLTSSNDGALALAAATGSQNTPSASTSDAGADFVKEMNQTAQQLGLSNSRFFNPHGLDIAVESDPPDTQAKSLRAGAYGSVRDITNLFKYTLENYPEILEATRYKSLEFESNAKVYQAENTNMLVDKIPGLIASKTGYTDLAGGNLVVAFDAGLNCPIIISVLGSTESGRFDDVLQLVQASLKYMDSK